jgi:hypothetical protein
MAFTIVIEKHALNLATVVSMWVFHERALLVVIPRSPYWRYYDIIFIK